MLIVVGASDALSDFLSVRRANADFYQTRRNWNREFPPIGHLRLAAVDFPTRADEFQYFLTQNTSSTSSGLQSGYLSSGPSCLGEFYSEYFARGGRGKSPQFLLVVIGKRHEN